MSKIPVAKKKQVESEIPIQQKKLSDKIVFSFEVLEFNEYFGVDGARVLWPYDFLCALRDLSKEHKLDLISGKLHTYRVHNHEKAKPPVKLPDNIKLKDLYQIRLSTGNGGFHGVFYENIFYILWLDPLHNLYPSENHGGLKKLKPLNIKHDDVVRDMQQEIDSLKEEIAIYKELLENA